LPPLSSTVRASVSTSGALPIRPTLSAEPLDERARDGDRSLERVGRGLVPIFDPTVVSSPCPDSTGRFPVLSSRKLPVPYVHLASPAEKQVWPKQCRLLVTEGGSDGNAAEAIRPPSP